MPHPDPDRLALAALPSEQRDPGVDEHVAGCALCRGHVEALRRTVELAVSGGAGSFDEDEHPPDRIWTAITGELAMADDRPSPGPSRWRRFAVPVAAAVLGVAAGVGIAAWPGTAAVTAPAGERPLATLAALDASGASGSAALTERDGVREVVVRVDGAAVPAGADYLEAWLMDGTGSRLVALGALAADGDGHRGVFSVPADLPLAEFTVVDVSAERWDGDERHSAQSLLRGPVV